MSWDDDLAAIDGDQNGGIINDDREKKKPITGDPNAEDFIKEQELPPDVLAVWGVSERSLASASYWVRIWGEAAFRESKVHRMALLEQERNKELSTVRQSYMKKAKK